MRPRREGAQVPVHLDPCMRAVMRLCRMFLVATALLLGVSRVCAADIVATAPAESATDWPELVKSLASEDYRVRDGAQALLDKLPFSQLNALRSAADTTTDLEAKARLVRAATDLEIRRVTDLP